MRLGRSTAVALALVALGAAACSSARGRTGATDTSPTTGAPSTTPATGPQVPPPFTEHQSAGLPGDITLRVDSTSRAGGVITIRAALQNTGTTAFSLGDLAHDFTFRYSFYGADHPSVRAAAAPSPVAPDATSDITLTFADPGVALTTSATLFFHGDSIGSDTATFALLSLLPPRSSADTTATT